MKKFILVCILSTLPSTVFGNIFIETTVSDITLKYISYDISSDIYNIKVGISEDAVSLSEISQQYNGVSAINGVFFCPEDYSRCNGLNYTINERFLNGEDLSFYEDTGERGVFAWDKNGAPFIHKTGQINPTKRDKIAEGLGNFPILLNQGKNTLAYYDYIGLYDNKMKAALPRHFICSNKEQTHIFIGRSSSISLKGFIPALQGIGCWDALNLDAGASSHFNYNGEELVVGKRKIIDAFIIQRNDLDTGKIEDKVSQTMDYIRGYLSHYSKKRSLHTLDILLAYITKNRDEVYEEYTMKKYDNNGKYLGYSLEITSLSDFEKVYTFNILEREIKKLYTEILD